MKILEIDRFSNNDFWADYECEHCGFKARGSGYDDNNFYDNVIPNAICPKCKLSSTKETEEQQLKRLGRVYKLHLDKKI